MMIHLAALLMQIAIQATVKPPRHTADHLVPSLSQQPLETTTISAIASQIVSAYQVVVPLICVNRLAFKPSQVQPHTP